MYVAEGVGGHPQSRVPYISSAKRVKITVGMGIGYPIVDYSGLSEQSPFAPIFKVFVESSCSFASDNLSKSQQQQKNLLGHF